jgi:hypothetical protein
MQKARRGAEGTRDMWDNNEHGEEEEYEEEEYYEEDGLEVLAVEAQPVDAPYDALRYILHKVHSDFSISPEPMYPDLLTKTLAKAWEQYRVSNNGILMLEIHLDTHLAGLSRALESGDTETVAMLKEQLEGITNRLSELGWSPTATVTL